MAADEMANEVTRERWEALYRRVYPDIYRALVATLFDEQAAADAMHDAFVEGLRRPPAHDQNLAGWLFRVALRKAHRARQRATLFMPLDWLIGPGTEPHENSMADAVLDRVTVGQLLKLLTERQRAVVVAYFYLGLRQETIAQLLGVRRGTVASTLARAVDRMRKGEGRVV